MSVTVAPTTDLATCLEIRRIVFVEEQGVSLADELDGLDHDALHILASLDGRNIGTARILIAGETGKIGRVCVLPEARGLHVGQALIRGAITLLRSQPGVTQAKLGAQTHALGFYEKLGFTTSGPVYDDAGIPHRDMVLDLAA